MQALLAENKVRNHLFSKKNIDINFFALLFYLRNESPIRS